MFVTHCKDNRGWSVSIAIQTMMTILWQFLTLTTRQPDVDLITQLVNPCGKSKASELVEITEIVKIVDGSNWKDSDWAGRKRPPGSTSTPTRNPALHFNPCTADQLRSLYDWPMIVSGLPQDISLQSLSDINIFFLFAPSQIVTNTNVVTNPDPSKRKINLFCYKLLQEFQGLKYISGENLQVIHFPHESGSVNKDKCS